MNPHYTLSPIDRLMIEEKFVKQEEMEKAYHIRNRNMIKVQLPLGILMCREGLISTQKMNALLSNMEFQRAIIASLMHKNLINKTLLAQYRKKNPEKLFNCAVLMKNGCIAKTDLDGELENQLDTIAFGKLAIKKSMISEKELEDILSIKRYRKSISEILYELNLITLTELNHIFQTFNNSLRIGTILLRQELITEEQLKKVLDEQETTDKGLGKLLVRKEILTIGHLYFALSIQFNIPFQPLTGFAFYEKQKLDLRNIVDRRYAKEHMIIPLFLNANNLTMAIPDPSYSSSSQELASIYNHIKMNCVLITEEKFEQLFALLYGEILNSSMPWEKQIPEEGTDKNISVLTDPLKQSSLIQQLFEEYKTLSETCGKSVPETALNLFQEFIIESHRAVCQKFNCRGVSIWFEIKENGVEINASPAEHEEP